MTIEQLDDDTLIAAYIRNRDVVLVAIAAEMEKLEGPVKAEQAVIEQELARRLDERKCENTKSAHGCAFFKTVSSLKTEDKSEWTRWVIGGENWCYANMRPAKTEIELALADKVFDLPPGLKMEYIRKVHVRKG